MRKIVYVITMFFSIFIFPVTCFAANYNGIDVSNWQGYIDYSQVKNSGISVVYIKASEGNSITDSYFRTNYENCKSNGLKVGFYHFLTARSVPEAIEQAEYFSSVISGTSPDCKLAMDFESFGNLNNGEINAISFAFLQRVQELTGKEVIIYSDAYNAQDTFSSELANTYPLWLAEYGASSPNTGNWSTYEGFQYSDTGTIPGINGYVDEDIFTDAIFLSSQDNISTTPNSNNNFITYTVKKGNTLSCIAQKYGTTVNDIAGLNGIINPNLIHIGQVLRIDVTNDISKIDESYETKHVVYTVKPGNTLTCIANKYGVSIDSIVNLNNIANPDLIYVGERLRINLS